MSLSTYLRDFLNHLDLKGMSANTEDSYRQRLGRYLAWLESKGITSLKGITYETLSTYITWLSGKGFSPRTISTTIGALRSFHNYLQESKKLEGNPAFNLEYPKLARSLPEILTPGEIQAILDQPDTETPVGIRDRAIIELFYATGARVSEVTTIGLADVVMTDEDNYVLLHGKGAKDRIVPLGSHAVKWLQRYLTERPKFKGNNSDSLFLSTQGHGLGRAWLWRLIKLYAGAAKIIKRVYPHIFRHSFATHWLKGGADLISIKEALGHSSISTTEIYTHLDANHLKEVHKKCHPRG